MIEYHTLTNRWSAAVRPHFEGIVAMKNEYDVYFAVCYPISSLGVSLTFKDEMVYVERQEASFPRHFRSSNTKQEGLCKYVCSVMGPTSAPPQHGIVTGISAIIS
jgi:hypothetical protein